MEVDFNTGRNSVAAASPTVVRQASAAPAADNTMSIERTQSLEQSLKNTSQVRPEKVSQASALVADESYPPDETLDRVAGLLAKHLNS